LLNIGYATSMEYKIFLTWDDEAHVWIAESDDIPGLILENGSVDALMVQAKIAAAELLEISGQVHTNVPLHLHTNLPVTVATSIESRHTANGIMSRAGINKHF
jgi:predicted RNase H-like HicB family nuclease